MDAEAIDARLIAGDALFGEESRVYLEQHTSERRAKVGSINGCVSGRFGVVDVLAFGAVETNGAGVRDIVLTGRKERVAFARNTRALPEITLLVLVNLNRQLVSNTSLSIGTVTAYHFGETTGSDNVTGMNKSVQVASRFLDLFTKVVVRIEVKNIGHEVQGILIVSDLGVKAGKVETISQIFLVDFAKVLVSAGRNEL